MTAPKPGEEGIAPLPDNAGLPAPEIYPVFAQTTMPLLDAAESAPPVEKARPQLPPAQPSAAIAPVPIRPPAAPAARPSVPGRHTASAQPADTPFAPGLPAVEPGPRKSMMGLAVVGLFFVACVAAACGISWLVFYSELLQGLRNLVFGAAALNNVVFRALLAVIAFVFALVAVFALGIRGLIAVMGADPVTRAQRQIAVDEALANAGADSDAILEKMYADLRAAGSSEEEIAEMRKLMETTRQESMAKSRAQMQEVVDHPERLDAMIQETLKDSEARKAGQGK